MILSKRWAQQPQGPALLNPRWAARGFTDVWNLSLPISAVRQSPIFLEQVKRAYGPSGAGLVQTGTSDYGIYLVADASKVVPTGPITIIYSIDLTGTTLADAHFPEFIVGTPTDTASGQCHAFLPYVDGNVYWRYGDATGISAAGGTLGNDVWVFTAGPRGREIWKSGQLIGSDSSTLTRGSNPALPLTLGRTSVGVPIWSSARKFLFALCANQLDPREIKQLSTNTSSPWQLFTPIPRRIWVSTAAAEISGTTTATLANATLVATGTLEIAGVVSKTLADVTSAATGTLAISGTLTATLANASLSATGGVALAGTLTQTLAAATLASTGAVAVAGAVGVTLADATLVAAGASAAGAAGELTATLAAATLSSAGTLGLAGQVAVTLANATLSSSATLALTGQTTATLAPATLVSTGALLLTGSASILLADCTIVATGVGPSVGGGAGAAEIWAYVIADGRTAAEMLTETNLMARELWRIHGLDSVRPLGVTPTSRVAGAEISQTVQESGGTVTVTRT